MFEVLGGLIRLLVFSVIIFFSIQSKTQVESILEISPSMNEMDSVQMDRLEREKRCKSIDGFKFCLFEGVGSRKDQILYFTHGVLMDGYDWLSNQSYQKLRTDFEAIGDGIPTVISVSHGPIWLLTMKNSRPLSGLLDGWNLDYLEKIENTFGVRNPPRRFIIGDSMGGHNALKLFNKMPEAFDKIVVLCPAQLDFSPFLDWQAIGNNIAQGDGIWATQIAAVGLMSAFYDEKAWQRESPFYFPDEFFSKSSQMQVVVTTSDMYGFTKANKTWIGQALSKGRSIDFHIEPGTHCIPQSMKMVADFLR